MKNTELLPIFKKTYDLTLALHRLVNQFPKSEKFTLGQKIDNTAIHFLEKIIEANAAKNKSPHLELANVELEKLRIFLRMATDLNFIDFKKYETITLVITEIGKMLGGWIKYSFYQPPKNEQPVQQRIFINADGTTEKDKEADPPRT